MTTTRRTFLSTAAATVAAAPFGAVAQTQPSPTKSTAARPAASRPAPGKFPIKVISSANGTRATKKAYEMILAGADPLDAVIAGVNIVEDDPNDDTVGLGGMPNEDGVVELDAAVMHGPTHQTGAVAALQNIKNPSKVARLVMEQTNHALIVGAGALRFAKAHGFKEENLLTERSRKIWLYWKQSTNPEDDWLPPAGKLDPDVAKYFGRPTGTIHCSAINANGDISCTTSTSGLAFKIAGRVGDSPIVGAGLYVDNEIGSCGSTGRGEANIQNLTSAVAVELMRSGMTPKEAGLEMLRRVVKHSPKRLIDAQGKPKFDLKLYLLAKDGAHAGIAMYGPEKFAVTDKDGTRLEECAALYQRAK